MKPFRSVYFLLPFWLLLAADQLPAESKQLPEELSAETSRAQASGQMLIEVDKAWQRPVSSSEKASHPDAASDVWPLREKLDRIVIPSVNFSGMDLGRVINIL